MIYGKNYNDINLIEDTHATYGYNTLKFVSKWI